MNVLEAKGLEKSFGDLKAVNGASFHIAPGETYGLLGPNGAGKTTAISMIAGLLEPDGGEVRINGEVMTPRAIAPKAHIGLVPQDLAIYPDLTAAENMTFFGRLYGMPRDALKSQGRPGAGGGRLVRPGDRRHQGILGGHEAAAQHRHRPPSQPPAPHPRRAHRRRRSPISQCHPRGGRTALLRGHGRPLHDPLHGRSRAPVRSGGDHRSGQDHGRGHEARIGADGWTEGSSLDQRQRADLRGGAGASREPTASPRRPPTRTASSCWSRMPELVWPPSSAPPPPPASMSPESKSRSPISRRSSFT